MRVWTNGSFARVWVTDTIFRYRDGALRVEESVKKQKGASEGAPDEVVAWAPKGARLDPALDKKRRKIIDAVASASRAEPAASAPETGIGSALRRLDGLPKVTGAEVFGALVGFSADDGHGRSVDLLREGQRPLRVADGPGDAAAVLEHGRGIVADVETQIERAVGSDGDAAGAGGESRPRRRVCV